MDRIGLQLCTVVSFLLAVVLALPNTRPPYIECVHSNECGTLECCTIGMGRFSLPACRPLREIGEACMPDPMSRSTNLSYPDGSQVALRNVFFTLCPCSIGLACQRETGVCADPSQVSADNFLWN